ncbi:glucosaminidase domain-containing protein [Chloroflexus sp.]|uniref:glucosaminidase domain-containing protein n=1 Tax=Chloroflexus sp. TaxID=1904827 RepID=UPI002ACD60DF|nr:glucosaminidase domain-containing protein [Chloroflexus sp.]
MSAFPHRKRPRQLGQPLFPIEDPAPERVPSQPLADLTADLDATLADRLQYERAPEALPGLRVPDDVRAVYERVQRLARVASPSQPRRTTIPERAPARGGTERSVGSSVPTGNTRPTSTLGGRASPADTASVSHVPMKGGASGYRAAQAPVAREPFTPAQPAPSPTRITAEVAVAERPARSARSAPVTFAEPLPDEVLVYELELPPPERRFDPPPVAGWFSHPLVVAVIGVISVVVIALAWMVSPSSPILSFQYANAGAGSRDTTANIALALAAVPVPGDHRLRVAPSLSPAQIDQILRSYGSPAAGTGEIWYRLGVEYNIDPAYAVAFFIHESSAGTNPNWAGRKSDGSTTHNVGNIICAGYPTCYGRFRDYPNWETGIADWYRLIDVEYIRGRGLQTVAEVIPIYAPAFENDVQGYINVVTSLVDRWRAGQVP